MPRAVAPEKPRSRAHPGASVPAWPFTKTLAVRSIGGLLDDLGPHLAASIAYRTLFSLVPLAVVVTMASSAVLSATGQDADVVDAILRNVPLDDEGESTFRGVLEGATADTPSFGLVGLVALAGLLWGASGMMSAIRAALNEAWDVDDVRPFVRGKLIDLALVLGAAALVLVSFLLSVGVRVTAGIAPDLLGTTGLVLGALPPLVLAFAAVMFLYRAVPATTPPLREIWPSAAIVAIAFVVMQNALGIYFENFSNFNAVYGSLGAVFGFLLFVYVASLVFLLGAELAAQWPQVRDELRASPRGT